ATAAPSGRSASWGAARRSVSRWNTRPARRRTRSAPCHKENGMDERTILLVEDNQDDIDLTLRAFRKNNIGNRIVVARDGVESLAQLFGAGDGQPAPPDAPVWPVVVLLD